MQFSICFRRGSRNCPFYVRHIQLDRAVHSALPYPQPWMVSNSSERGEHHTFFSLSIMKTINGRREKKHHWLPQRDKPINISPSYVVLVEQRGPAHVVGILFPPFDNSVPSVVFILSFGTFISYISDKDRLEAGLRNLTSDTL